MFVYSTIDTRTLLHKSVGRCPDKKLTVDTGTIDKIDYAPVLPKYLLLWL